jgi:hypothetical protein
MNVFVKSLSSKRIKRFLIIHGIAFSVLLFLATIYKCPIYAVFHVPCPGCGITRAHFAALSLDFKKAFRYHPLFFTVLPLLLYVPHRKAFRKPLNAKTEAWIFFVWLALFLIVYIFRLSSNNLLFDR